MSISARSLNRATLGRQLLLRRENLDVGDAVRRAVALQAQQPASPYIALWNRLAPFDPVDLDVAFANRQLVKATLLRATLHVVHADDHRAMYTAMLPALRGARLGDRRFTATGLSAADADAMVPELLEFADKPRTAAEFEAWLDSRFGIRTRDVWWALRSVSPLLHAPTGGPWSFGSRPSYVAVEPERAPREMDTAGCLQTLVRRYLEGFGPASVADIAQFAKLQRSRVRGALSDELVRLEGHDGTELFDVPGAPRPSEDTPAPPRLMAMWDSVLLAHADRSRVVPPEYSKVVTRFNGDVLPTLLVDGYVAGVWRPVENGIEATAFHRLPAEAWEALAAEARALMGFLADREPRVYRRFDRWWSDLPRAEVRVL